MFLAKETKSSTLLSEVERELSVTKKIVTHAMIGRQAMLLDACAMLGRGIALVMLPVVVGVLLVQAVHIVVAVGLGQDGGRCDVHQFAIALNHRLVGCVAIGLELITIDNNVLGAYLQPVQRAVHGQDRGVEDIDLINLLGRHDAECPRHRIALDILAQGIALLLGQLLRVIEQGMRVVSWEYHRRRIHITRQATTTRLIAARLHKFGMETGK